MKTKEPIVVAIPNTTQLKMQAILNLSAAISELSKTLASNNEEVKIENCHIENSKGSGITITKLD
jgi:hypothetical protein